MNNNGPALCDSDSEDADALVWRERDRERARLLLERAGDIARRMERACRTLTEDPLPR